MWLFDRNTITKLLQKNLNSFILLYNKIIFSYNDPAQESITLI